MGDVYQEVDDLMTQLRVEMHKIKSSLRKYAFELPDIPKEADYLKLMYPYESKWEYSILHLDRLSYNEQSLRCPMILMGRLSHTFSVQIPHFLSNSFFGRTLWAHAGLRLKRQPSRR